MAYCEDQILTVYFVVSVLAADLHAAKPALRTDEPVQPVAEADLAPERYYLFTEILHNIHKYVGADVRLCIICYALRRPVCLKLLQNPAKPLIIYSRIQLAV